MHRVRQEALPFRGSSHVFAGAEQGDVGISAYLFHGETDRGPGPHTHPYDEVQFVRSGRGVWIVDGTEFTAEAGDILIIKAGEVHQFRASSPEPLVLIDVHVSPRFIQDNLT